MIANCSKCPNPIDLERDSHITEILGEYPNYNRVHTHIRCHQHPLVIVSIAPPLEEDDEKIAYG